MTRRLTKHEAAAAAASAIPIPSGQPPDRSVRTALVGEDPAGHRASASLEAPTLVLFLSMTCDGCADLADLVRNGIPDAAVLGVLRRPVGGLPDVEVDAFVGDGGRWLLGDDPFLALDIRSGPFFCLIGEGGSVLIEGVAFGATHVGAHVVDAIAGRPRPDAARLEPRAR